MIKEQIEKMKRIEKAVLEFVEEESNAEENYENLMKTLKDEQISEDRPKFELFLRLINQISNEHQRVSNFINKILRILEEEKKDVKKHFSNSEIFDFFADNKRILLFLFEEKVIIIDDYIFSEITSKKYNKKNYEEYFLPEIKEFLRDEKNQKRFKEHKLLKNEDFVKTEISEDFYDKRREGENDNYLCYLIRSDLVKDFGVYMNRHNLSFDISVEESIFETNSLILAKSDLKLIEYASFYGSIEVIKYMKMNYEIELTSIMWFYAIHSCNSELIRYLEDNHVEPPTNNYNYVLRESIKSHHNDVSNYVIYNLIEEENLKKDIENKYHGNLYRYAIEFDNYLFFPTDFKSKNIFLYLCEFNYHTLVKLCLEEGNIEINYKNIKSIIFQ